MISGPSCSQSPIKAKYPGNRRQPGTIVQTGEESVKIIIAFCSLSRGVAVSKAEYQKRFRVGSKGVADLSCLALLPRKLHLTYSPGGRELPPAWMGVHERSLRQGKISELFCAFPPVTGRELFVC